MADVFLSYAREDRDTAERLARALEARGWSVWWDRHVPAGKRFDKVIAESLTAARCVVVLWSKAANDSEWVGEEAEEARERGLLIPALIEAIEPPLGFRRIQAADLVGWDGDPEHPGLQRLLADIAGLLGATPASPPTAVVTPGEPAATKVSRRRMLFGLGAAVILGVAAVLGWRLAGRPASTPISTPPAGAWIDGRWRGSIAYGWAPAVREVFDFRVVGGTLTGSAGFLGRQRAIEDGAVGADGVRFAVRWTETDGSAEREAVNRYVGARAGDALNMVLSISGGVTAHDPVTFTLERAGE